MKAVGIGEVLWDIYGKERHLGGAPLNFAYHARALGADALVVSRVGGDELGRMAVERCRELGLPADFIQADSRLATGTVLVKLDDAGVPGFTIRRKVAWDRIEPSGELDELAARADCVAFGTLAQREELSRSTITAFLAAAKNARRIFDVNLRQNFYTRGIVEQSLKAATVLKLSGSEMETIAGMVGVMPGSEHDRLRELVERYELELAALTLGAAGCILASPVSMVQAPAPDVEVVDTVGSGDAFTAALAVGMDEKIPLEKLAEFANMAGAYVATQPGATPPMSRSILSDFAGRAGSGGRPGPSPS